MGLTISKYPNAEKEAAASRPVAKIKGVSQLAEESNNASLKDAGLKIKLTGGESYNYSPAPASNKQWGMKVFDDTTKPTPSGGVIGIKMHSGGPVKADGLYQLKAGEHVLTAKEAAKARTHAILASGLKSLSKPAPSKGTGSMTIEAANPKSKPVVDTTRSRSESLVPPSKPGMPKASTSPSPNAVPGGRATFGTAHPEDNTRPGYTGVSKT